MRASGVVSGKQRGQARDLCRLVAGGAVLTAVALAGVLALIAGPAQADVTSGDYTIGSPPAGVVVSPGSVAPGASTNFEVDLTLGTGLAGSAGDSITITPSEALGSAPTNVALISTSCGQSGTAGGAGGGSSTSSGLSIELGAACGIAAESNVEVQFTADAPSAIGALTFMVTSSKDATAVTSNGVSVISPRPNLSALAYAFGANTTYTISGIPVADLTSSGNSLALTASATAGTGTIAFLDSGSGGAGYTVEYVPPDGAATSDTVTNASASGATVTLTLATPLASGEIVGVDASGQNPASSASAQSDEVSVQPGNGTPEGTNAIGFGGSVTDVSVTPASLIATMATNYTVDFRASDAVSAGGDLYLTEAAGPTNFSSITSIEVSDSTQGWHFTATGAILADGAATIPLQDAIDAGDSISISLGDVTNPPIGGSIGDFTVASTGDPVAAEVAPYAIVANASPGVLVTVEPSSTGATATYTISNLHASGALTGGTATIQLDAPAGTVFPDNPSFYTVTDQTSPSGSGTVSGALSGGGTNVVTFTVPNNINQGDLLTLGIADVRNPSTSSSTDSIVVNGDLNGPPPIAPAPGAPNPSPVTTTPTSTSTSTSTTASTTPATTPAPAPTATGIVSLDGTSVTVKGGSGAVKLTCTGGATCSGKLTLTVKTTKPHVNKKHSKTQTTTIGTAVFSVAVGKTITVRLELNATGRKLLGTGHGHLGAQLTISKISPSPPEAQTKTVHLSESKPAKRATHR